MILARTDVLEERFASIIRVPRIGELETLAVTSNRSMQILVILMMEVVCSSKMSVLTRTTWHNFPEDSILHCYMLQPSWIIIRHFFSMTAPLIIELYFNAETHQ
jgi:hypothetical protein